MVLQESAEIIKAYHAFLNDKQFPCVGAKAALAKHNIKCMVTGHMACPHEDRSLLHFLYRFVNRYRKTPGLFHSAAILFSQPVVTDEEMFDRLLWNKLQALSDLDAAHYDYDHRVSKDPSDKNFSFSLKGESFYIIGLHPASSRLARRFQWPALVFNPHAQFEKLRETKNYEKIKSVVRKRDIARCGSVNPMLDDFGESSETVQYSGRVYDNQWKCPLNVKHGKINHHSTP
jgi:FPC/CPF motif-containing protein YcgG